MLYYLFTTLYVVACFVLMIVILLQQGKGGDIAAAFGGGSSQAVFGARAGATLLTKVTAGLTVAFMSLALLLAIWGSRGTGSVVGGVDGPAPVSLPAGATDIPFQAPATTPAPTAPASEAAPAAPDAGTPPPATTPPPAKKQ
ncbi:MAG: preprotein translocase subunit SecG [Acidobacteria bacterium]|nr:preprotein translocase subunit SecG [Acidobacteriota bacterium]